MSVKKDLDGFTKVTEDDGFFSGPLSEQILSSEEITHDPVKDNNDSTKISHTDVTQLDSGLDLTLSEDLSNVKISDKQHSETNESTIQDKNIQPLINITDDKDQDVPPLTVLFEQDDDGDT